MTRLSELIWGSAAGFLALVGGCNSVLGIEEAELLEGSVAQTDARIAAPSQACDSPNPTCGVCIETECGPQLSACLQSSACRRGLSDYRACLGRDCRDTDQKCFQQLQALQFAQASAGDVTLAECVEAECVDSQSACKGEKPLAEVCDLYCACMTATCATYLDQIERPLGDCKAACLATPSLTARHCRWTHCEIAAASAGLGLHHCEHAIGLDGFCEMAPSESDCDDKSKDGWGCKSSAECCSGNCSELDICQQ